MENIIVSDSEYEFLLQQISYSWEDGSFSEGYFWEQVTFMDYVREEIGEMQ